MTCSDTLSKQKLRVAFRKLWSACVIIGAYIIATLVAVLIWSFWPPQASHVTTEKPATGVLALIGVLVIAALFYLVWANTVAPLRLLFREVKDGTTRRRALKSLVSKISPSIAIPALAMCVAMIIELPEWLTGLEILPVFGAYVHVRKNREQAVTTALARLD